MKYRLLKARERKAIHTSFGALVFACRTSSIWCEMRLRIFVAIAVLVAATALPAAASSSVIPDARSVTTGAFDVRWSATNPEEITSLSWHGSPNLTNSWFLRCTGDLEYWGDSWGTDGGFNFVSPVGWGTTGTWSDQGSNGVRIDSAASGCFGTTGIPVDTSYRFWDKGARVDSIRVDRKFRFGSTPFAYDFRPYIPRLYPRDQYSLVLHPDASGTTLLTEIGNNCEFGCEITNWDGTWFAIHDPLSGQGMIVRHESSTFRSALWVDMDGGSQTTASSVLLLQPPGGFTGTVVDVQLMCLYDSNSWTPGLTLPAGCS